MGKAKPKRNLSDKVRRTKQAADVRANPFEVKINRQKFSVIGRKQKHDRGLPGVSRSKSIKKRMGTLLLEHKQKHKSNVFVDRRIGENDASISLEDKLLQRFAKERQRQHTRENVFALRDAEDEEEEQLTHYGQSLADTEALGDAPDSDSDTGDRGLLSAEFTETHFGGGGGLLRKKKSAAAAPAGGGVEMAGGAPPDEPHRSRKELIEELITKSKKEKFERQNAREQTLELTEKLDADWKQIQSLLSHKTPKALRGDGAEEDVPRTEAYDVAVRELAFEMKAKPSERLKTAEEMARQEAQRLQHLETARLRRMRGAGEERPHGQRHAHQSADDLNDDFDLDDEPATPALAYQDGKLKTVTWADDATAARGEPPVRQGHGDEEDKCEEEEAEEDKEDDDDDDDDSSDDDSDGEDDHSDLESDEQGDSEEQDDSEEEAEEETCGFVPNSGFSVDGEENGKEEEEGEPRSATVAGTRAERRPEMEAASRELPFTFSAPTCAEELRALLDGFRAEQRATVVARLQACTHPSLAEGNKDKLGMLLGFLLEYMGELARRSPPDLSTVDLLVRPLYDLAQLCPRHAGLAFQAVLTVGHSELSQHGRLPSLEQLVYLKLVSIIFPTSDFRHPVVTPATVYLSQILTQCAVSSLRAVAVGLFACHLLLEFVRLSQRFVPELLVHLHGLLVLALPPHAAPGVRVVPPFRARGRGLLLVRDAASVGSWSRAPLSLADTVAHTQRDENPDTAATATAHDHFRISAVGQCLELARECVRALAALPSRSPAFRPLRELLETHLDLGAYPPSFQAVVEEITAALDAPQTLTALRFEKSRPQPLKMFQPKVEQVLEFGRKKAASKPEKERKRLVAQHKREWKGAVREIRRDTQFLARQQLKEQMDRDSERKRKVKELHHLLATQEGEWKALKRKKMKA